MTKKIKKIILFVIVAIITFISVFSCFKGNNTPEPILTPVSVLKPAKSDNDNVISPTGTYDNIYFNESITFDSLKNIFDNLSYTYDLKNFNIGTNSESCYGDFIIINESMTSGFFFSKTLYQGVSEYEYALRYLHISNSSLGIADLFAIGGNYGTGIIYKSIPNFYSNPLLVEITGVGALMGISIGQQNNLLTELISPVPFLFEGTSNSIAWTSSGLDNPNNIQDIYFNTNLTNQAVKNILDTYIGDTAGVDIFYYLDDGIRVRCYVINNSANAFIQIIGGTTTLYKWIYDPIDTDEQLWWYGIDPAIIDNGNVIISPRGNSLNGFNIYELRALFSSANDFTETPSGDSYEQGYQDGYNAGETAGYNKGYTAGETAGYNQGYTAGESSGETAGYNKGYTAGETAGYNQGYLDGLDDGAGSNVNFQYIESVLTLIGNFLNIEILPNIKLSYALGIIIILSIISIIKMVVK